MLPLQGHILGIQFPLLLPLVIHAHLKSALSLALTQRNVIVLPPPQILILLETGLPSGSPVLVGLLYNNTGAELVQKARLLRAGTPINWPIRSAEKVRGFARVMLFVWGRNKWLTPACLQVAFTGGDGMSKYTYEDMWGVVQQDQQLWRQMHKCEV